jgi:hypothetical protein
MNIPTHEIARRAAAKLSPSFDPNLSQLVEGVLTSPEAVRDIEIYDLNTSIAIASLIVAIAAFGWTIYNDVKKPSKPVAKEVVIRKTSLKFEEIEGISDDQRRRIIETVVEETIQYKK